MASSGNNELGVNVGQKTVLCSVTACCGQPAHGSVLELAVWPYQLGERVCVCWAGGGGGGGLVRACQSSILIHLPPSTSPRLPPPVHNNCSICQRTIHLSSCLANDAVGVHSWWLLATSANINSGFLCGDQKVQPNPSQSKTHIKYPTGWPILRFAHNQ